MIKNKIKLLYLANFTLLIILIICLFLVFFRSSQKIVYVDNIKVFEGFNMTKEMKRIGEKEFNTRKLLLDSLYSKLQSPTIYEGDKKLLMQQLIQGKEELDQFNQKFASQQSSKIWTRIRSYVGEFSKENDYKIVIGSENIRTVLFADETIDVSNDLITYINKKYEGLN